jgi:polar amino acid transport system substrate-binding protein
MSHRLRSALLLLLMVGMAVVASSPAFGDDASKPLVVCAVPAALPRTGRAPDGTPRGLDVALVQRLGQGLGRTVEFHWCASAECSWHCLPTGRCDVVIGQPLGSAPSREVAWSVPYAGAQFGLVVPRNDNTRDEPSIRSLADLGGKRVGIVTGTVAVSEKDHALVRFPNREAVLEGFAAAGLDAALVDADFAAWFLHEHPGLGRRLGLVAGYVPREHWNMAVAVRTGDGPLLVAINRVLAQLAESGEIRKIYEEQGVPLRPPFTFTDSNSSRSERREAPETWRRVKERGELVVSMDPANLPYSSARDERDRPGLDVELARALARQLGVRLRIEWLDVQHETAVGELLKHQCDLVLGEAIEVNAVADDEPLAGKVVYSRPYYGTGYVLVHRKKGPGPAPAALAALKPAPSGTGTGTLTAPLRLGTEAGSIADYRLRQRGLLRQLFRNQLATLKALDDGGIDYAYLWANVGWTLHVSPDYGARLELVPGYVPEDHWNIAIAMSPGDDELKRHVDAALESLINEGTVAQVLARYHVAAFAPFPEANRDGTDTDTVRHAVIDRGPEPQMQRVQGSKAPYSGLARVRSAGELVVGLDPNQLPLSTAHPAPGGLDHEVAGLLAAELGVPLRVFWGLSAHDSYPSQLTTKKHCDVILGVMPDDRFAQRVLYSRPYYQARYLWVVPKHGVGVPVRPPGEHEPVAVEQGIAVRGLKGRPVRGYPSTEAILDAVAPGRETAGYVISTRGPWLAQERWPGALAFLPGPPADRFPICAAVRKTDGDLKDAIDRAWERLDRSGRLAEVFARWHIPYESATTAAPAPAPSTETRTTP